MTAYDVWAEGYRVTGNASDANKLNDEPIEATTFDDAVRLHIESLPAEPDYPGGPTPASYYRQLDDGTWCMWGCRLSPDEATARKNFG